QFCVLCDFRIRANGDFARLRGFNASFKFPKLLEARVGVWQGYPVTHLGNYLPSANKHFSALDGSCTASALNKPLGCQVTHFKQRFELNSSGTLHPQCTAQKYLQLAA